MPRRLACSGHSATAAPESEPVQSISVTAGGCNGPDTSGSTAQRPPPMLRPAPTETVSRAGRPIDIISGTFASTLSRLRRGASAASMPSASSAVSGRATPICHHAPSSSVHGTASATASANSRTARGVGCISAAPPGGR